MMGLVSVITKFWFDCLRRLISKVRSPSNTFKHVSRIHLGLFISNGKVFEKPLLLKILVVYKDPALSKAVFISIQFSEIKAGV